jgi:hypothetical protein
LRRRPRRSACARWRQASRSSDDAFSRLADFDGDGPALVAQSGDGLYLRNSNDLTGLFARVMNDQRGYYLLA